MPRPLLLLLAVVASTAALTCYTCDSFLSCTNPRIEYCPPSTNCYILRQNGEVAYKGCTSGCHSLPYNQGRNVECGECSFDHCNNGVSVPGRANQQPQFNNAKPFVPRQQQRRSIGHGAGVQQPSIGNGVSGGYGSQGNYGIGSGAYSNDGAYNNGGIGSGVGVGHDSHKHKQHHSIGQGAQSGHRIGQGAQTNGVGGGAVPTHRNRNRRDGQPGWGIGDGARPTRSASGLFALAPITIALSRFFQ